MKIDFVKPKTQAQIDLENSQPMPFGAYGFAKQIYDDFVDAGEAVRETVRQERIKEEARQNRTRLYEESRKPVYGEGGNGVVVGKPTGHFMIKRAPGRENIDSNNTIAALQWAVNTYRIQAYIKQLEEARKRHFMRDLNL